MNETKIHPRWASGAQEDSHVLRKQLMREITCLERQVSRIKMRPDTMTSTTVKTYEDMIATRKSLLAEVI